MGRMTLFWIVAILITLFAAYYQRTTGPTYPKKIDVEVNDTLYEVKLVRSISLDEKYEVKLAIEDTSIQAKLFYKRFSSQKSIDDDFRQADFNYDVRPVNSPLMNKVFKITEEKGFFAEIDPALADTASKVQYYIGITDNKGTKTYLKESPVVIRFKGAVPAKVLIPHVFFMFFTMLLATLTGLLALFKNKNFRVYTFITFFFLLIGGMILGPVVQKFAFGEYWTGVPFGWDLTDNKTLFAFVFWVAAIIGNWKKENRFLSILASVMLLLIFSIPHSMFGSELDYETGTVTQGLLFLFAATRFESRTKIRSALN
jgi:hypothetical protein